MEGFWGMGSTVSSYSTAKKLEVGAPGGRSGKKTEDPETVMKRALADRIEDKLGDMLDRVESLLKENRREILALAYALETHRTLTGEDVEAVLEGGEGPAVDGRQYGNPNFVRQLEEYHQAAAEAHEGHGHVLLDLPEVPEPVVPDQVWERPLDTHPDGSDGSEPSHGEAGTFRKE
jgi:hypothetical protein